ncbi:MAG: glycosyltransferase family 2 protein [Candidatus Micrarchaeota archaeon]|nr:glycosyltransferase family 2 protein [Candidatus Micrarchaeota archaeon]
MKYRNKIYDVPKSDWQPKVSVVIPAYNEGILVEKCIRTVLASEYPKNKFEVILVDDGSTDDTYKIAKSINDSRLKVFTKTNSGKAASINFGIKHATGEVIATMDADSFIEKDTVVNMLPFFDSEDVAAVTAAVRVKPSNKWLQEVQRIEYLSIIFSRRLLSFLDAVPVTPGPFSMFRAWVFQRLGGFDETNIVEDHEMALRIQSNNYKIRCSIGAEVYTETPGNMSDLLKQRVRWYRGGIHNTINYRHLMSPKYGDYGVFVVPIILLTVLTFIPLLAFAYDSLINPPIYSFSLGFETLLLSINPVSIAGLFLVAFSFFWAYAAVKAFKNESGNPFTIFLFLVFYGYLTIVYNILTIVKEIRKERFSW